MSRELLMKSLSRENESSGLTKHEEGMSFPNGSRPAADGEDGNEEGEAGRDNRTGGGRQAVEDEVCLSDDTGGQLRAGQGVHEQGIPKQVESQRKWILTIL